MSTITKDEDYYYSLSVWSGLVAAADAVGDKYKWQQCVSTDKSTRKTFKNVYKIQVLTCHIEECLFWYLRLFVYEVASIQEYNYDKPIGNLESLLYCMQRLVSSDIQCKRSPRLHKWWMHQSQWSKQTRMDHFIDDVLIQACKSICSEHYEKATAKYLADKVNAAVKKSASQIIDMFVALAICQNYTLKPSHFSPFAPCETGIYACSTMLRLIRQMVEDSQSVNDIDVYTLDEDWV